LGACYQISTGVWGTDLSEFLQRQELMKTLGARTENPVDFSSSRKGTPPGSGYQTPREVREAKWSVENETVASPSKIEMREMYKALDGRKAKGKGKIGTTPRRDRGGWDGDGDEW
jgi:hypothetical protein